jgi:flagellar protein FlaH
VDERVLLVDGGAASLQLTKRILEQEGYEVEEATTGRQALRLATEDPPQLILIDANLPDIGWNELSRSLRAGPATERLPIVILSSQDGLNDMMIGGEAYADEFLVKPFTNLELQQAILPLLNDRSRQGKVVVSTGNNELDGKMGGGIPLGSLVLIEGSSGAGKSVLMQQLIWGSLQNGFDLTLLTTENSVKSLIRQMRSLSLDVLDFFLLRRFRILPLQVAEMGPNAAQKLLAIMERQRHTEIIFVDSLTSAVAHARAEEILRFFEGCKRLCGQDKTVAIVVHSHAISGELLVRLRALCDAHLQLHTEEMGDRLVRTMEVTKIRGADKVTGNIVSFEVEPGWGMRPIPVNKVKG